MKRYGLIALLGLGTVVGYGGSCASMHMHRGYHHQRFEDRVAEVCAAAALRVTDRPAPAAPRTTETP